MRFWDTSALLSLVLKDDHHRKSCRWLANESEPHVTSSLVTFEAENRLHALHLKNLMTGHEYQQRLTALRLLFSSKLISEKHLRDTRSLSADCRRLISVIFPSVPHGTLDDFVPKLDGEVPFFFDAQACDSGEFLGDHNRVIMSQ